jgi:hypothetical protein
MTVKDSFGIEVDVGDYLVFATKGGSPGSLSLGRVTKLNPSGGLSMIALDGWGKTLEEAEAEAQASWEKNCKAYHDKGIPLPEWLEKPYRWAYNPRKTTLKSASTCYKVPGHAIPPVLTQALSD